MENEVNEEVLVTDGGYKYIVEDDLKIRDSFVASRLKVDGETFPEYKVRQKLIKSYTKDKLKGKMLWFGNRGTYVKKDVEKYIREMLEQKKRDAENGKDINGGI